MLRVEWSNICNLCNCPLNIRIIFPRRIDTFIILKCILCTSVYNLNLEENKRYIKIKNRKKTYMCKYCFNNGYVSNNYIIQREISGTRQIRNKAWTKEDLHDWCEKVYRIISNETCNWSDFLEHYEYIYLKEVDIYRGRQLINYLDLLV